MTRWTTKDIPDQSGRRAVVTGASSGIGEEAAAVLAGKGAEVSRAVRARARGEAARARIEARTPGARLEVELADMADLGSVRSFATRLVEGGRPIDILLNNAGLGMQPTRDTTVDGFERQFGTNHLGHFALTGLLVPALLRGASSRVVTISSIAHRGARLEFDDLGGERSYNGMRAYNQSKLANLAFALELDRRTRAAGSKLISVAAHPGMSATGFVAATRVPRYQQAVFDTVVRTFGQGAAAGAWPGLYAATMPDVKGGQYWGPDGLLEVRGRPAPAKLAPRARDQATWTRLWQISEDLTHVHYPPLS